jgi:hemerythrin
MRKDQRHHLTPHQTSADAGLDLTAYGVEEGDCGGRLFNSFWNRLILRKKAPQGSHGRSAVSAVLPQFPTDEHGGKPSGSGVRKIDEQHQAIRESILKLQKELRGGSLEHPLPVRLDALLQQMNRHFHYEEGYLEHINFPELTCHRGEHEQFRARILQLRERAVEGDNTVPLELSSYLFNWFKLHNLKEEAAFAKGRLPS